MWNMFERIITGVRRMLTRKTLKKELGDITLTSSMIQKSEEWNSMLYGEKNNT